MNRDDSRTVARAEVRKLSQLEDYLIQLGNWLNIRENNVFKLMQRSLKVKWETQNCWCTIWSRDKVKDDTQFLEDAAEILNWMKSEHK